MNMSEQAAPAAPDASPVGEEPRERIFLVVVDETEEMKAALRFACRRALHTGGRVALFYAIEPPEFQHWQGVERMMQDEARQQAEEMLQALAAKVQADTGKMSSSPCSQRNPGSRSWCSGWPAAAKVPDRWSATW